MSTHLSDAPIEVLEATLCQECKEANMAEYACRDEIKSNTPICVDCCHCSEHDQCDPCEYWIEVTPTKHGINCECCIELTDSDLEDN